MKISEKGIDLIKYFEGVRETPYKCPAGYWTVGVGHLISRNTVLPSEWNRTLSTDEIAQYNPTKSTTKRIVTKI